MKGRVARVRLTTSSKEAEGQGMNERETQEKKKNIEKLTFPEFHINVFVTPLSV